MMSLFQKLLSVLFSLTALFGGHHFTPQPHVNYGGITPSPAQLTQDAQIDPYTDVQIVDKGVTKDVLEIAKTGSLPEEGQVKTIIDTTQPKITLQKFNGEVSLGITSLDVPANTTGSRPFLSKNVEWQPTLVAGRFGATNDISMEAVPIEATTTMEDGGMEINIILNSKPTSNVFTFQLDNYQNLDFFYQAPLWQEAGLKAPTKDCNDTDCTTSEGTSHRPDNTVGSYAVYYKSHANHIVGQTNYATGKAYHIFRPLVTDANGATVWADLSYSNGVLTVTVPQGFLDGAVYPVKVDPTFGYTTIGGSLLASSHFNQFAIASMVNQITANSGDTITSYSLYASSSAIDVMAMTAYTVVSSQPSVRLAIKTSVSITSANSIAWYTSSPVSQALSAGTIYCVAIGWAQLIQSPPTAVDIYFDAGSAPGRFNSNNTDLLDPFSVNGTDSGRHYSFYATYTAGTSATTRSSTIINTGASEVINNSSVVIP